MASNGSMRSRLGALLGSAVLLGVSDHAGAQSLMPPDAEAAQILARRNDCFKCHAIDKAKKGPPYKRVAARLRTKPDGVEVIVEHITSGRMVQLEDGSEEKHKVVDTKDPEELKNLARWLLSL